MSRILALVAMALFLSACATAKHDAVHLLSCKQVPNLSETAQCDTFYKFTVHL